MKHETARNAKYIIYGSVHEISVLAHMRKYAQMPLINVHADVSSEAGGLNFGLRLHLHPYFVNASSEGSYESAHRLSSLLVDAINTKISCTDAHMYLHFTVAIK